MTLRLEIPYPLVLFPLRVEVNQQHPFAGGSYRGGEVDGGGRFSYPALLICNCDDLAQLTSTPVLPIIAQHCSRGNPFSLFCLFFSVFVSRETPSLSIIPFFVSRETKTGGRKSCRPWWTLFSGDIFLIRRDPHQILQKNPAPPAAQRWPESPRSPSSSTARLTVFTKIRTSRTIARGLGFCFFFFRICSTLRSVWLTVS